MKSSFLKWRHKRLEIGIASLGLAFMSLAPNAAWAIGEKLIAELIDSDFVFTRAASDAPFLPIGALDYSRFNAGDCHHIAECEPNHHGASQYLGLPVWVGEKNMFVIGETINYEHFERAGQSLDVYSGGALFAWGQQYSPRTQWGAFYFSKLLYLDSGFENTDTDDKGLKSVGSTMGFVARYQKCDDVHWYWGAIRDDSNDDILVLPYLGFDWQINQQWGISGVMPWPSIHYAPHPGWFLNLGLSPGGTYIPLKNDAFQNNDSFQIDRGFQIENTADYSRWDLGLTLEKQLSHYVWLGISAGRGVFGSIDLASSERDEPLELDDAKYFRVVLNLRPSL